MEFSLREVIEAVELWPPAAVYALLLGGAFLEYVFPPVPGDAVVLAGAVLVGASGWNPWFVFGAVTLGSALGAAAAFGVGRWLVSSGRITRLSPKKREAIEGIVTRFERRGALYLAINRFFPGIRAFFFVAAGLAGYRLKVVLLWSTVSALIWNGVLMSVGVVLGHNVDEVDTFFTQYTWLMWGLIALVVLVVVWRIVAKRKRASRDANAP